MKSMFTYTRVVALLSFLFFAQLPDASAQGWAWARSGQISGCDAWAVACDNAGNVFGAGINLGGSGIIDFGGGVTSPASVGFYQTVWVKYNNAGVPLWAGGTLSGSTWLSNIATDPFGNLIVYGFFTSATMSIGSFTLSNAYTGGIPQYFLAKINPSGTVIWAIKDGKSSPSLGFSLGGAYILSTGGVATDATGNIYISGNYTQSSMTIGAYSFTNAGTGSTNDAFVAKYDPSGTLLWAAAFGGTGQEYGLGVTPSSTGHVYVCGAFTSPTLTIGSSTLTAGGTRPLAYIAEFTSSGTPVWGQAAGGGNGAFAVGMTHDNYGNVYMTGGFGDNTISFGSVTVTRPFPTSVPQLATYLVQYSPADVVTFSKSIGSRHAGAWGFCIAMASCGQVWVSGNYTDTIDIDGNRLPPVIGLTTPPDPVFIAGYNLSGGVVGYAGLPSGGDDQNGIAADGSGNVFICSDYWHGRMVAGPDTLPPPAGAEGFYVAKYANTAAVITDTNHAHQDTAFCGSDSLTLRAPAGYVNYYWNDGSSDTILRASTGTYWVFCVSCGDTTLCDTFHVFASTSDTTYASSDTTICRSIGSVTLTAPATYTSFAWSTGSTSSSIVAATTGTYWVRATAGCNMAIDTFHVSIVPDDTTTANKDTSVCASIGVLTLNAPAGYPVYHWSTGATTATISVSSSGIYYVYSTNVCNTKIDTFDITFMPVPVVDLGPDTAFCVGNTLTLSSPQPAGSLWNWSTGATSSSITVSTSGSYSLTVTYANGCTTTDDRNVTISPIPIVDLGPDTAICNGTTPLLQSIYTYPGGSTYLWNTGATTPSITAATIGTYWLRVTVVGCPNTDTLIVKNLYDTLNFPMIDTAICRGQYIQVRGAGTPGMTYQWTPTAGIASSALLNTTIRPDTSAMYYVRASISTCPDLIDSFFIDVQPTPVVFAGGTKSVCQHDSLHLHVNVAPAWYTHYSFSWSPGAGLDDPTMPDVVFTPGSATMFYVTVTTPAGCSSIDSAQIIVHPGDFASLDTTIRLCPHDSATFLPKSADPATTYRWHPGLYLTDSMALNPKVRPITSQTYYAVATSSYGCLDTVYGTVLVVPAATMSLGDSVTLYPGESYRIPTQSNCTYYTWFPPAGLDYNHIASPLASPQVSTKYIVHGATEWGCKVVDSISIYVTQESVIDLPNAFTPGSNVNKNFKPVIRGIVNITSFTIFNRWGNLVYDGTNPEQGWDGTYKGVPQPFGVYVYQVEGTTSTGKKIAKKGNVTLVR